MSPYLILCCVCVISRSAMSNSLQPHGLQSARLLCPWGFSRQEYWSGLPCLPLQGIFPTQESNPGLLHYRWIFLPSELPGKPKNTGMGSLSFLQGIFPTQGLNPGLPHSRQILYCLSHQGNPTQF